MNAFTIIIVVVLQMEEAGAFYAESQNEARPTDEPFDVRSLPVYLKNKKTENPII
jgi:hypothetical protein